MASYGFPGGILRRSRQAFNAAAYTCEARHTLDPVFQQEWNDEQQLGLIFDYWAQYFLPCMDAQGYLIPTGNTPTREPYVADFHTPNRLDWWPQRLLSSIHRRRRARPLAECLPAYPPDEIWLFADEGVVAGWPGVGASVAG